MDEVKPQSPPFGASSPKVAPAAPAPATPAVSEKRAHEEWAAAKKTEKWKALAAKAGCGWPIGFEVTESDFDQAVDNACNHVMR